METKEKKDLMKECSRKQGWPPSLILLFINFWTLDVAKELDQVENNLKLDMYQNS